MTRVFFFWRRDDSILISYGVSRHDEGINKIYCTNIVAQFAQICANWSKYRASSILRVSYNPNLQMPLLLSHIVNSEQEQPSEESFSLFHDRP